MPKVNSDLQITKEDWKCLHLLSKKENIEIPVLLGKMVAICLSHYEDILWSKRTDKLLHYVDSLEGIPYEEFCKELGVKAEFKKDKEGK